MSPYKLVQFLKPFINPQGIETAIVICSQIARKWLCKLRYEYKNVQTDIFVDSFKRSVVEDFKFFLEKIEKLKPYIDEFEENGAMKPKIYPPDCKLGGNN